jgi:hypothetical protein
MKEATGELNMTVITVVAIAAVGMLFTIFVWPNIQSNMALNTACSQVDANGNYSTAQGATTATGTAKDGEVSCNSFTCTVYYNNKSYSKKCSTT